MGLFALANSFTMRVCLSITIVTMVTHVPATEHIQGETCPDPSLAISDGSINKTVSAVIETVRIFCCKKTNSKADFLGLVMSNSIIFSLPSHS